jgi:signal transduction histidine kinase
MTPDRKRGSLRGRLALALTGLSLLTALLLAGLLAVGEEYAERQSLEKLHAYVNASAPDDRAVLDYRLDLAQRRRSGLIGMVIAATGFVTLMAWWLSGRLARRTLEPLGELVRQIEGIDLEHRGQRLALASSDTELQVIVGALNAHMAELDGLVERERAFAAAASHELRTPLTVIGGAAALLAEQAPASKAVLARIERALSQARQDLEALLALSRTREPPARSLQQLDRLLPELASLHVNDAGAAPRIAWDVAAGTARELAPGALSIVFGNLLRNALRAAPGGELQIGADHDGVTLTDRGPGLPPELLAQPFQLLGPRPDGGTGMGLYIAQMVARRQGWTLSLGAAPGGGTRAELRF